MNKVTPVIDKIKTLSYGFDGATGALNDASVVAYAKAMEGLNLKQAQLALSTKLLTSNQREQILVEAGLIASSDKISLGLLKEAIARDTISADMQKEMFIELGLIDEKTNEAIADATCTKAKLLNVLATRNVSAADQEAILSALGLTAANNSLTFSFEALGASIKTFFATNPIGWIALIIGGVAGVVATISHFTETLEESREKLKSLKEESNTIDSDLKSMNDELATTVQRMKELEGKGTLTFTEKEEYDNLVKTNNELERKISLLKLEQNEKNKEKSAAFVKTMEKDIAAHGEYHVSSTTGEVKKGQGGRDIGRSTNEQDYIAQQFRDYKDNLDKIAELDEQYKDDLSNKQYQKDRKRLENQNEKISKYLKDKNTEFTIDAEGIGYIEAPKNEDEEKVNKWLDFVYDFQDRMAIAMGAEKAETNAFNRIVDNWQFDDAVQELQDLGEQGQVTADMLNDPKYDGFIQKLVNLGVIDSVDCLEVVALAFNKVGEEIEETNKKASDSTQDLATSIKSLSETAEGIGHLNSAMEDFQESGSVSFSTIADIQEKFSEVDGIEDYINTLSSADLTVNELNSTLSDLTYKYLEAQLGTEGLANANVDYVTSMLKEQGVSNASAVATDAITRAKEGLRVATELANAKTSEEIVNLASEAYAAGITGTAFNELVMDIGIFNNTNLDVNQKIAALQELGYFASWAGDTIASIGSVKKFDADGKSGVASYDENGKLLGIELFKEPELPNIPTPAIPKYTGSTSKKSGSGDKDKSASDAAKNLADAAKAQALEELKHKFELTNQELEKFGNELSLLDDKIDLTFEGDYASKIGTIGTQFKIASEYSAELRYELEQLRNIVPKNGEEAEALADQFDSLSEKYYENQKAILEYRDAVFEAKADLLNEMAELSTERQDELSSMLDRTMSTMENGSITGGFFGIGLTPSKTLSAVEKQRKENDELLEEERRFIEERAKLRKRATEMSKQDSDAEYAEKKADYLKDLAEAGVDTTDKAKTGVNDVLTTYKDGVTDAVETTKRGIDEIASYAQSKNVSVNTNVSSSDMTHKATGGSVSGNAIVNEKGLESVILPNGTFRLLGDGDKMVANFPNGSQILNAKDTAELLAMGVKDGEKIPHYEKGSVSLDPYIGTQGKNKKVTSLINGTTNELQKAFDNMDISMDSVKAKVKSELNDTSWAKSVAKQFGSNLEKYSDTEEALGALALQKNSFDDLSGDAQGLLTEGLGVSKENWDEWISKPENAIQAMQLCQGQGIGSWDLLSPTVIEILNSMGINSKQTWDLFVQNNPLQALQLLLSSWDALTQQIQQYMNTMIDIVTKGAEEIHAIMIDAPQVNEISWELLRSGIQTKISEIINQINSSFQTNKIDLKFSLSTSLPGSEATNPQGIASELSAGSIVNTAKQYLGVPYKWGGTSPNGFDCSGLMQYVYAQNGIAISRTTYTQVKEGVPVSVNALKPGDLVFFGNASSPNHVGMYAGNGQYIEAPYTGANVRMSSIAARTPCCARRILNNYAMGTGGAKAGYSIVGDGNAIKGDFKTPSPELIFRREGGAELAGLNGTEIVKLNAGDTVVPYEETMKILNGTNASGKRKMNNYATGTLKNKDIINELPKLTKEQITKLSAKFKRSLSVDDVYNAQQSTGISALVILGIGALESGWGAATIGNNFWGYGATNDNPVGNAHKYSSNTAASAFAREFKKDYYSDSGYGLKTLAAIGSGGGNGRIAYAQSTPGTASTTWASSIDSIMQGFVKTLEQSDLTDYEKNGAAIGEAVATEAAETFDDVLSQINEKISDGKLTGDETYLGKTDEEQLKNIKLIRDSVKGLEKDEKILIGQVEGVLTTAQKTEDLEAYFAEGGAYDKLIKDNERKVTNEVVALENSYEAWQKDFSSRFSYFIKNTKPDTPFSDYHNYMSEAYDRSVDVLVSQAKVAMSYAKDSVNELKSQREVAEALYQTATTPEQQDKLIEVISNIDDKMAEQEDSFNNAAETARDLMLKQINVNDGKYLQALSYYGNDLKKLERQINKADENDKDDIRAEMLTINEQQAEIQRKRMEQAHQNNIDLINGASSAVRELLDTFKLDEVLDVEGNTNAFYDQVIAIMNSYVENGKYSSEDVQGYKTLVALAAESKKIWYDANDALYDILDNTEDLTNQAIDEKLEKYIKLQEAISEKLEFRLEKGQLKYDAKSSLYEFQQALKENKLEAQVELQANKELEEYLDPETRKLLFNDDDYSEYIEGIDEINAEINREYKRYLNEINSLKPEEMYLEEELTKKWEQQLKIKQEELDVLKDEMNIAKKTLEYNNAAKERDTQIILGNRIVNVADPDKLHDLAIEKGQLENEASLRQLTHSNNDQLRDLELDNAAIQTELNSVQQLIDEINDMPEKTKKAFADSLPSADIMDRYLSILVGSPMRWINENIDKYMDTVGSFTRTEMGDFSSAEYDYSEEIEKVLDMYHSGLISYDIYSRIIDELKYRRREKTGTLKDYAQYRIGGVMESSPEYGSKYSDETLDNIALKNAQDDGETIYSDQIQKYIDAYKDNFEAGIIAYLGQVSGHGGVFTDFDYQVLAALETERNRKISKRGLTNVTQSTRWADYGSKTFAESSTVENTLLDDYGIVDFNKLYSDAVYNSYLLGAENINAALGKASLPQVINGNVDNSEAIGQIYFYGDMNLPNVHGDVRVLDESLRALTTSVLNEHEITKNMSNN